MSTEKTQRKLLLLHGAIGSKAYLQPLADALGENFSCHSLNFNGHGGEAKREANSFNIAGFGEDVLRFLDQAGIAQISIFGYSMGGYVALWLARHHPMRIESIFTLATKMAWSPEIAARETKMLNAEVISQKVPKFAQVLEKRHAPLDWKAVLTDTATMLTQMGDTPPLNQEDFEEINRSVRLGLGDRDKMVSLDETREVFQWLPNATLTVLPQTPHPMEQVNINYLASELLHFFK